MSNLTEDGDFNITCWDPTGYCILLVHANRLFGATRMAIYEIGIQTMRVLRQVGRHEHQIHALTSFDECLYSCSEDNVICRWSDAGRREQQIRCPGENNWPTCLCVFDGRLCSGMADGTVLRWNERGELLATLSGHDAVVMSVCRHRRRLFSGDCGGTILGWNSENERVLRLKLENGGVYRLIPSPRRLYVIDAEGNSVVAVDAGDYMRCTMKFDFGLCTFPTLFVMGDGVIFSGDAKGCMTVYDGDGEKQGVVKHSHFAISNLVRLEGNVYGIGLEVDTHGLNLIGKGIVRFKQRNV